MPDLPQLLDSLDVKLEEQGRRNAYRALLFSLLLELISNRTLRFSWLTGVYTGREEIRNMAMAMELKDWVYSMA